MTTQHTPGLLTVQGRQLIGPDDELMAIVYPVDRQQAEARAAHLAACWNAIETAGIDPAAVLELVKAIPDPDKLDKLARWFDLKCPNHDDDVQRDLRLWASRGRAALAKARPEPEGENDGKRTHTSGG